MTKIAYIDKTFRRASVKIIEKANEIIEDYEAQGFDLTLRQLYYQFVSKDLIENSEKSYKRLGNTINDARLAGLVSWEAIVDRTRNLRGLTTWDNPGQIIRSAASGYRIDPWENQEFKPEVWIEKDALVGVIEGVCDEFRVDYFACRGYNSQSEQWRAARRARWAISDNKTPIVFYFGDHDPSGMDMPRDLTDRFAMFMGGVEVKRLALNLDQVEQYNPPPNPAKMSDARATAYIADYGDQSWELDALDPPVIAALIRDAVNGIIEQDQWDADMEREQEELNRLSEFAGQWDG